MTAPSMDRPILVGAGYSLYTRICLMTLALKGVAFRFEPLDVFAEGGRDRARAAGQPFGRIPVFRHAGLTLFETLAITRYIDQSFDGPALEPADPALRARMNQIVSIVDTAVYPVLVWGLYVPRSEAREPEPGVEARSRDILMVLDGLAAAPWLCGDAPTLADAYLAASMPYLPEGWLDGETPVLGPRLQAWWQQVRALPALATNLGFG